jgi:hypothetical protein
VCDYFWLARRVSSAYRFESSEKGWFTRAGDGGIRVCVVGFAAPLRPIHIWGKVRVPVWRILGFWYRKREGPPPGHNPTGLFRIHRDLIPCVPFLIGEPPEKSSPPSAPLSRAVTHLPDLTSAIIKRLLSYYSNTADFVVLMAQTSVQRRQALEECLDTTVHPTWPSEILFSWDFLVCWRFSSRTLSALLLVPSLSQLVVLFAVVVAVAPVIMYVFSEEDGSGELSYFCVTIRDALCFLSS